VEHRRSETDGENDAPHLRHGLQRRSGNPETGGGPLVGGEANLAFDLLAARMIVLTHPDAATKEAI